MSRDPVQIIVNADDLGRHGAINDAIAVGIAAGTVTSSTIMANGTNFDEAMAIARAHPPISFGVHLNLTEFSPLTGDSDLADLLCNDGTFDRARLEATPWSPTFHRVIVNEWSAQVARIRARGVPITHLDSHQHVHTLPQLFLPFKSVRVLSARLREPRPSRGYPAEPWTPKKEGGSWTEPDEEPLRV